MSLDVNAPKGDQPLHLHWTDKLRAPFVDKTAEEIQAIATSQLKEVLDLNNKQAFVTQSHEIAAAVFSERKARLAKAGTWQAVAKKVITFFLAGLLFVSTFATIVGCLPLIYLIRNQRNFNRQIASLGRIGETYMQMKEESVEVEMERFRDQLLGDSMQFMRTSDEVLKELTHKKRKEGLIQVDQEISVPGEIDNDLHRAPQIELTFGKETLRYQTIEGQAGRYLFYRKLFMQIKAYEPNTEKAKNIFDNVLALLTQDLWAAEATYLRDQRGNEIRFKREKTSHTPNVANFTEKEMEENFGENAPHSATYRVKFEDGKIRLASIGVFRVEEYVMNLHGMGHIKFHAIAIERELPRSLMEKAEKDFEAADFHEVHQTVLHSPPLETLNKAVEFMTNFSKLEKSGNLINYKVLAIENRLLRHMEVNVLKKRMVQAFNTAAIEEFEDVRLILQGYYNDLKIDAGYEQQFKKDVHRGSTIYSFENNRVASRNIETQNKSLMDLLYENDNRQWLYVFQHAIAQNPRSLALLSPGPNFLLELKRLEEDTEFAQETLKDDPEFAQLLNYFSLRPHQEFTLTRLELHRDEESDKIIAATVTASHAVAIGTKKGGDEFLFLKKGATFQLQHRITLDKNESGKDFFRVEITGHHAFMHDPVQEAFAEG